MNDDIRQLEETNHRLRLLHGVLDMAVLIGGDVIAENVGDMTGKEWHDALIARAQKELSEQQAFEGRWFLYSADELLAIRRGLASAGSLGEDGDREYRLLVELDAEIRRRNLTPPEFATGG